MAINPDGISKDRLYETASKYFLYQADQRMKSFNFYIVFIAAVIAGFCAIVGKLSSPAPCYAHVVLACLGFFMLLGSIIFGLLDLRCEELVNLGVKALKSLENDLSKEMNRLEGELKEVIQAAKLSPSAELAAFESALDSCKNSVRIDLKQKKNELLAASEALENKASPGNGKIIESTRAFIAALPQAEPKVNELPEPPQPELLFLSYQHLRDNGCPLIRYGTLMKITHLGFGAIGLVGAICCLACPF